MRSIRATEHVLEIKPERPDWDGPDTFRREVEYIGRRMMLEFDLKGRRSGGRTQKGFMGDLKSVGVSSVVWISK